MVSLAKVNIWNRLAGGVAWDNERGLATFEFEPGFSKLGWDLAPLTMPMEQMRTGRIFSFPRLNPETYQGLPGLLADSLPDRYGNKLIEVWLARNGRDPQSFNPVERLCYIGKRGMGALEFEPAIKSVADRSHPLEIEELVRLAQDVLNEREGLTTNIHATSDKGLLDILRVGTSAGGARPKAIIAYNEKTGDVRSGQIDGLTEYTHWVIKFDGVHDRQLGDSTGYGRIEYAYYLLALQCGISMTECRLLEENDRAHFMTKRFDREGNEKLHMQTLCALAHFNYNDPTAYSYEQAFQVMRQLRLPYTDAEELYRRMCFNVIARNQDDHTKNIAFLMNKQGIWRLSPAYDMIYAYNPVNKWLKNHQLSVNGKRNGIVRDDLREIAKKMNIKKPAEILDRITASVSNWERFAKEAGVAPAQSKQIKKSFLLA
ncbi:MAG: type II toxin-antitoxin system HipA family toxin [bacterium]